MSNNIDINKLDLLEPNNLKWVANNLDKIPEDDQMALADRLSYLEGFDGVSDQEKEVLWAFVENESLALPNVQVPSQIVMWGNKIKDLWDRYQPF